MAITLSVDGVLLPSPTAISDGNELIWSSNTGRATTSDMIGDVIGCKQTVAVQWEWLTEAERQIIADALPTMGHGFAKTILSAPGRKIDIDAYRGTITSVMAGVYGGELYYRSVSTDIIEQ